MYIGWTGASAGKEIRISANTNNVMLSSFFSDSEWQSGGTKTIVIDAGVTVGSISDSISSMQTGTLVGGGALGGTLKLINNGAIYGKGGITSGTVGLVGGTALEATTPITVINNGNIYGGGGGGGRGGTGASGYHWPESKAWNYAGSFAASPAYYVVYSGFTALDYTIGLPTAAISGLTGLPAVVNIGAYQYYKGDFTETVFAAAYHKIRRRTINPVTGGLGGSGAIGQGSDNLTADPGNGGAVSSVSTGGLGGSSGTFGQTGASGAVGGSVNTTFADQTAGAGSGSTGGLGGYYINGESFVTWEAFGNRLGRVTG